ncbi:MAG: stage II sporulation protein P [Peptococcaceae bacterium]|nr:stage II sporulation protein P [Peptococcaceae bacterium]
MRWLTLFGGILVFFVTVWVQLPGLTILNGNGKVLSWNISRPHQLMKMAWPAYFADDNSPSLRTAIFNTLNNITGVNLEGPGEIIISQMGYAAIPSYSPTSKDTKITSETGDNKEIIKKPAREKHAATRVPTIWDHVKPATITDAASKSAVVGIYNTHTGETYLPTDGVTRFDGRPGGVVKAAQVIGETLVKKYGISVVRSEKIHDVPYNRSYFASYETARSIIEANPGLKALLDIHRDSKKGTDYRVVELNGVKVATILLIVGSDARQPFPEWHKNLAFANRLAEKADEMYPGLCLGVRVLQGRYNQFLHPRAVLVEIGSVNNTEEEALRAARLFADVLAAVLSEETVAGTY